LYPKILESSQPSQKNAANKKASSPPATASGSLQASMPEASSPPKQSQTPKYFELNNENTDKKNSSLQQQRYESSKVSILSSQNKKNSFNRGARSRKTSFAPFFSALKIDCRS
jgi:hypothetical protein